MTTTRAGEQRRNRRSRGLMVLLLTAAMTVAVAPLWAATAEPLSAEAVLLKVSEAYAGQALLHVDLKQTSTGVSYFDPVVQTGSFTVQKPDKIRWVLDSQGGRRIWISNGKTLWVVDETDRTVQLFTAVGPSIRRYIGFLSGLRDAKSEFDVSLVTDGSELVPDRLVMKLVPKSRDDQLRTIYVQVDATTWRVRGVVLLTPFGDRTDMQLSAPKDPPALADDRFSWTARPGWQVVPMDLSLD